MNVPLLEIKNLMLWSSQRQQNILQSINLRLMMHKTLALIGESGCGKSLLAKTLIGLNPISMQPKGKILFKNRSLLEYTPRQWRAVRGKEMSLLVQDASTAFDPLMTIQAQFRETLQPLAPFSRCEQDQKMAQALNAIGLSDVDHIANSYPHQLSGGQLQQIMIAIGMALKPTLLIADECTTALDTITQYAVITQFKQLVHQKCTSLLFISHDLGLIRDLADDVAVIKAGAIVEYTSTAALFSSPTHPYTEFLLDNSHKLSSPFTQIMAQSNVTCC